jgi:hypothetical protein
LVIDEQNLLFDEAKKIISNFFPKILNILKSLSQLEKNEKVKNETIGLKRTINYNALNEFDEDFRFLKIDNDNDIIDESNNLQDSIIKESFDAIDSDTNSLNEETLIDDAHQILEDFICPIKSIDVFAIFQEAYSYKKSKDQNWFQSMISELDDGNKKCLSQILQTKRFEIEKKEKKVTISRRLVKVTKPKSHINLYNSFKEMANTNIYFDF